MVCLEFLNKEKFASYWANTSANTLISKLMQEGNRKTKEKFETLLKGDVIWTPVDEQIVYKELDDNEAAIWSLLLASGYLKVLSYEQEAEMEYGEVPKYELAITNYEVKRMFYSRLKKNDMRQS